MAKCRHRMPYLLNNYHGLEIQPIVEEDEDQTPELDIEPQHVPLNQPVLHPPDPLPLHHQPEVQPVSSLHILGPVTRSKARNAKK